jgi:hypothetical protein
MGKDAKSIYQQKIDSILARYSFVLPCPVSGARNPLKRVEGFETYSAETLCRGIGVKPLEGFTPLCVTGICLKDAAILAETLENLPASSAKTRDSPIVSSFSL